MDHKVATVLGTAAALIAGSASAEPAAVDIHPVPIVSSYSQLLEPIPDAAQRLKAADAMDRAHLAKVQLSLQFGAPPPNYHHHHHHHHSNDWYRRNGYVQDGDQGWVTQDFYNRHHHHHNYNDSRNYDRNDNGGR